MNTVPSNGTTVADPKISAKVARLRYVSDEMLGIRRRRHGRGFAYTDPYGRPVKDKKTLGRIEALVIPPAWEEVWICPFENGHIQATGRDAKGRKQFRYHPRWHNVRSEAKFQRLRRFGELLPQIRRRVQRDLKQPGIPREKVLAAIVCLLEQTFIRIGNEEYARTNRHYGLTTLRDHHVEIDGSTLRFNFPAKSGKERDIDLHDPLLAQIVKQCQDVPGYELFQYCDDLNACRAVGSGDVNNYLREITGEDVTAKDFRTWPGTLLAVRALCGREKPSSDTKARRETAKAVKHVAERLGNTPAVCRKYYIHPRVLDTYAAGRIDEVLQGSGCRIRGLNAEEKALMALLQE
jgi:DNA topoisomerase-1